MSQKPEAIQVYCKFERTGASIGPPHVLFSEKRFETEAM